MCITCSSLFFVWVRINKGVVDENHVLGMILNEILKYLDFVEIQLAQIYYLSGLKTLAKKFIIKLSSVIWVNKNSREKKSQMKPFLNLENITCS